LPPPNEPKRKSLPDKRSLWTLIAYEVRSPALILGNLPVTR
jgi:hypothetical protein